MSIFLLPKIIHTICDIDENDDDIEFKMSTNNPGIMISHSLYNSLCQAKIKIEENEILWDNYKKIMNPYEFIHTIIPGYKTQVSKMTPLSRSFYKMIEISTIFNLCHKDVNENNISSLLDDYIHNLSPSQTTLMNANPVNESQIKIKNIEWYVHDNYYYDAVCNVKSSDYNYGDTKNDSDRCRNTFTTLKSKNIFSQSEEISIEKCVEKNENNNQNKNQNFKSFHLAEGPGGFIEAMVYLRKNKMDEYYGMTLINNDSKCPGWKKSKRFIEENPNVIIEKGADETGNLLSRNNFMHCYKLYKNKMNLVTGDGGVDFSENFNNQEQLATKLIIAQVAYALIMQSDNGNFVLKVFDTFSKTTVDVLYLLSSLYKNVYIMKPQTSRYANSERYVICKGYCLYENEKIIDNIIKKIYNNFDNLNSSLYIETIYNFKCSHTFVSKLEEINIIIGKRQIDNIIATLNLLSNKSIDKIDYYKKKHMQKCIKWCEKYSIQFYKNIKMTNIFLTPSLKLHSGQN